MTTPVDSSTPEHIHVSVAWPYANGDLHAGHFAGTYLPADIFARYHRLKGNRVLMVSGSDSHGTPISVEADKRGIPPRELFEHFHAHFLDTLQKMGISFDLFTHTDTENHHRIARDMFTLLLERGYLYKQQQRQLYSVTENRFLTDRAVEGECPICHFPDARGDQCDNCGNLLDAVDLINPRSKSDGSTPIVRESEHYFLDLAAFIPQLREYLSDKSYWRPSVLSVSQNKLEDLHGRPVTRDIDWGVPIPVPGWEEKKMYVWLEAVMGYFTASVEYSNNIGQPDLWKRYWYNPDAKIYNFLGKDNIEFHTIIWPAELFGVDGIYASESDAANTAPISKPYDVPANEFMTIEGKKFSKSRNWAIWMPDILQRYAPDAIRYAIAAALPETKDGDWSWAEFFSRNNNELVAKWGNLINRTVSFAHSKLDGVVPILTDPESALTDEDRAIMAQVEAGFESVGALLDTVKLRSALNEAMALVREANAYLDRRAPWTAIKTDRTQAEIGIYVALNLIANLNILLSPFLPFSAQTVHAMLGNEGKLFADPAIRTYQESSRPHDALTLEDTPTVGAWRPTRLPSGQALGKAVIVFKKLGDNPEDEQAQIEAERARLGT